MKSFYSYYSVFCAHFHQCVRWKLYGFSRTGLKTRAWFFDTCSCPPAGRRWRCPRIIVEALWGDHSSIPVIWQHSTLCAGTGVWRSQTTFFFSVRDISLWTLTPYDLRLLFSRYCSYLASLWTGKNLVQYMVSCFFLSHICTTDSLWPCSFLVQF